MEYRFIHHWQYEPGMLEHQVLESAIELLEKDRTENFLQEIAAFIAGKTSATYVVIGLLVNDGKQVKTYAFLKNDALLPNYTYDLSSTPCNAVVIQRFCYYPMQVAEQFPDDAELKELGIESYLGSILLDESNEPLGLIALMDEKPLHDPAFAEHLILVLSPAMEEELARIKNKQ